MYGNTGGDKSVEKSKKSVAMGKAAAKLPATRGDKGTAKTMPFRMGQKSKKG